MSANIINGQYLLQANMHTITMEAIITKRKQIKLYHFKIINFLAKIKTDEI